MQIMKLAQFGNQGIQPPALNDYTRDAAVGTNALLNLEKIVSNVIGLVTTLGAILFIAYFILGALGWISSGGDTGKVQKAQQQMLQGVIGLVVLVAAYAIVGLTGSIVGLEILSPASVLESIIP